MHDHYYLVAIIDNNYIDSNLYDIFWEVIRNIQLKSVERREEETALTSSDF